MFECICVSRSSVSLKLWYINPKHVSGGDETFPIKYRDNELLHFFSSNFFDYRIHFHVTSKRLPSEDTTCLARVRGQVMGIWNNIGTVVEGNQKDYSMYLPPCSKLKRYSFHPAFWIRVAKIVHSGFLEETELTFDVKFFDSIVMILFTNISLK